MSTPVAPSTPTPRRPRRAIGLLAIGLAVLATLAAAACTWWPVPTGFAERMLAKRLQRTVHIEGDARFCLCPHPTVRADTIEIGPPEWSKREHFARLTDFELSVTLRTLLGGRAHVRSIAIGHGEATLERDAEGRASWQFPTEGGDTRPPSIDRLEAKDVGWRFIDPSMGADLSGTLSLVDGTGRPGPDRPDLTPRLEVRAQGRLRDLPVIARIEGGSVLPGGEPGARPLKARARVGEGRLAFDGEVDALASLEGLRGRFDVRGPALAALGSLVGAVLPRTPPFSIEGTLRHVDTRWEVSIAKARVGESDLRGDVVFVPAKDRDTARLEGRLESSKMRIADLGRSVGFGERTGRTDRVLPDVPLNLPSLRNMEAGLAMTIARLELGATSAPITDLVARVRLEKGVLAIGEMKATVAGGALSGDIKLDATDRPGRLDAALRIRQVALERWLPKLRGEPPVSSRMNAEVKLAGRGDSVADVLGRANGQARIALGPGSASRLALEVAGLDIAEALAVLSTRDKAVRLDCGLADVTIKNGVATPTVMMIDTRDTVVTGEGSIDLSKERLKLRFKAAPRDFSPLTVRSPIDVAGTFKDPSVAVDKTRIAGTVIASVVLGAIVAPLAAVLPLLDFGEDVPSACAERYGGGKPAPPASGASR